LERSGGGGTMSATNGVADYLSPNLDDAKTTCNDRLRTFGQLLRFVLVLSGPALLEGGIWLITSIDDDWRQLNIENIKSVSLVVADNWSSYRSVLSSVELEATVVACNDSSQLPLTFSESPRDMLGSALQGLTYNQGKHFGSIDYVFGESCNREFGGTLACENF
jgi:hypothetical protein